MLVMANLGAAKMLTTIVLVIVFSVLLLSSDAQAAARRLGTVDAFGPNSTTQLKKATPLELSNPSFRHPFYVGIKRPVPTGPNPLHNPPGIPPPSL